ncbi:MAG: acetolactate decarboxylase, partial [Bacteroidota bacterium]
DLGCIVGSYTRLDGELVMLDGVPYQVTEDGRVSVPHDTTKIVYANATHFQRDGGFSVNETVGYDGLRVLINEQLPSQNMFYAFRIHGNFQRIKCGGLNEQTPPYTEGLDVLIPNRPVFERENVAATMVGFFCPKFIGQINVAGYHLHLISDDKSFGGHVMEFEASDLEVEFDEMARYQFELPDTEAYREVGFAKSFQYEKQ